MPGDLLISNPNPQFDRREFLCGAVAVAAAGALGITAAALAETQVAGLAPARTVPEQAAMFLEHFINGWLPLQTAAADAKLDCRVTDAERISHQRPDCQES